VQSSSVEPDGGCGLNIGTHIFDEVSGWTQAFLQAQGVQQIQNIQRFQNVQQIQNVQLASESWYQVLASADHHGIAYREGGAGCVPDRQVNPVMKHR
jgi:hypothetical protein